MTSQDKATDVTVYIGRFNPFHLGHAHVLEQALANSKLVIVLVGSSGYARSLKNPFTFHERKLMIEGWQVNRSPRRSNLVVLPLRDYPYNDALWIKQVQKVVKETIERRGIQANEIYTSISLTGSDRDHSTWYLGAFPQWKQALVPEFHRPPDYLVSATSVREILFGDSNKSVTDYTKLKSKVPETTADFLIRWMDTPECALLQQEAEHIRKYKKAWEAAPYAPTFVTTDCVVIQSGHVLVVERGAFPGKGLWALPGGFLDNKELLINGACRELVEETGISLAEGKRAKELTKSMLLGSIKGKEIFDHPDRSLRGRTITVAFLFKLDDTKQLPKVKGQNAPLHETGGKAIVETAKAFWLPINEALERTSMWFEDHSAILETMVGRVDNR